MSNVGKNRPFPPVQCWDRNRCPLIAFVSPTLNGGAGEISKTKRPRLWVRFALMRLPTQLLRLNTKRSYIRQGHATFEALANIVPIFKKGKRDLVENYRPISLLPVISKVLERCVLAGLRDHISHLISREQHGFLAGRSCVT